jgi:putative glycosyltransferase (TIGR04372 family)
MPQVLRSLKQRGRDFLITHPRLWKNISKLRVALRPRSTGGHLAVANALCQQGNQEAAIRVLRRTVKHHPTSIEARCSLGRLLTRTRQDAEADDLYRQSIDMFPQSAELLIGYARFLSETRRPDQALTFVDRAIKLQPDSMDAHEVRAAALALSDRHKDAVACRIDISRRRLASNPGDVPTLCRLASNLHFSGNMSEAREAWDRALAVNPAAVGTYEAIWAELVSAGKFELARDYYQRHQQAQRAAAQKRSFRDDGTRYLRIAWSHQIGHLAHLDWYIKAHKLGLCSGERLVMLAQQREIANRAYLGYWEKFLQVVSDPAEIKKLKPRAECFEDFLPLLSLDKLHEDLWTPMVGARVQGRWAAAGKKPLLTLTPDHIRRGRDWLRSVGIPENAWFVTVHIREPGFRRGEQGQTFRDATLSNYLPAFRHIVDRGGWVVRMGNPSMTPLPPMRNVLDYAHFAHHADRQDWIDVFLAGHCRFHIGCQGGLSYVPGTFGVPSVMTNWVSWAVPAHLPSDIFIPKQLWSETEARPTRLEEIFKSDLAVNQYDFLLSRFGSIRLVENTDDEILEAVQEMLDRLDGAWSDSRPDDAAQRQVQAIAARHGYEIHPRVGCRYLRRHAYLLD